MNKELEVTGIGSESILSEMEQIKVLGGGTNDRGDTNNGCVNHGCAINGSCSDNDCNSNRPSFSTA